MSAATAVRERPILFSGPMVRAILDGSKTQTRRVVRGVPRYEDGDFVPLSCGTYYPTVVDRDGMEEPGDEQFGAWTPDGEWATRCPYGQPGDRLWVRETFAIATLLDTDDLHCYAADHSDEIRKVEKWRPSIHMPRRLSRIPLEVTGVRVERVQDISEADAVAEGIQRSEDPGLRSWPFLGAEHPVKGTPKVFATAVQAYRSLWDSLNASRGYGWDVNPWVWVIEFRQVAS